MQDQAKIVPSPCVGLCSTTYGDEICRGCMRSSGEINTWQAASNTEKNAVLKRLDAIIEQVMPEFFCIENQPLLEQALKNNCVPYDPSRSCYAWLHKLLVRAPHNLNPEKAGFAVQQRYTLYGALQQCRTRMYALACNNAHAKKTT